VTWVMRNLSSVRLEIVLVSMNIPQAQKSFRTHTMELLGDVGHVESYFIPFGDTDNLDAR
jgi:hypothetical protein